MRWWNFLAADERWKAILKSRVERKTENKFFFSCTPIQPFYVVRLRWWCGGASWKVKINRRKKIRDDDEDKNFLFHHSTQSIDMTLTVRIETGNLIQIKDSTRLDSLKQFVEAKVSFVGSGCKRAGDRIKHLLRHREWVRKQIKSRIM